jgi:DNA-binding response OmpR family regulator
MANMWTTDTNYRRSVIYNILIVEGKPILGIGLKSALAEEDFNVVGVSDYFEALWRLDELKPDLVIMNVELPLLDGWEACYRLHQIFGIPIILLGRDTDDNTWVRAVQAGADFYLREPFNRVELAARIKAILRRYKTEQAG